MKLIYLKAILIGLIILGLIVLTALGKPTDQFKDYTIILLAALGDWIPQKDINNVV